MKRIDFYKRLYYMLVLISLNIVLLEALGCRYDPNKGECVADYPFAVSCDTDEIDDGEFVCIFDIKNCEQVATNDANDRNCPILSDNDFKCIYDSTNKKCKEALLCLSVNNPSKENCENAPTRDDTTNKCIYDNTNNQCKEALLCLSVNNPSKENCENAPTRDDTTNKCIYEVQIRNVRKLYYVYQLIILQKKIVRMLLLVMIQQINVFMIVQIRNVRKLYYVYQLIILPKKIVRMLLLVMIRQINVFMIIQIINVRKIYYVYQLIILQNKIAWMPLLLMVQKNMYLW